MFMMFPIGVLASVVAWVYCEYKYDRDDRFMRDMKREASAYLSWARERKMKFTKKELVDFIFAYKMEFATWDAVEIFVEYILDFWKENELINKIGWDVYSPTNKIMNWEEHVTVENFIVWIQKHYKTKMK